MPHKVNAARRHHIPTARFKVTNRAEYEAWLHRSGSLTLCIADEAIDAWDAAARARPGGQASCYDSAIQTCLMLRTAFTLALSQAEGLMTSVVELLDCELAVPDHTTLSRRAIKPPSIARAALPEGPLHVLIDSPGLKVHGAGEWPALAPPLAQAAPGARRWQRPDRRRDADRPGCRRCVPGRPAAQADTGQD